MDKRWEARCVLSPVKVPAVDEPHRVSPMGAKEFVISDVKQMLRNWQVQVTHPRYFGLFNPSVHACLGLSKNAGDDV